MRITFVIASLGAGGAQRVVVDLTAALAARGNEVSVVTYAAREPDHFALAPGVDRLELDLLWNSASFVDTIWSTYRRWSLMRKALISLSPHVVVSFIDLTNVLTLAATRGLSVACVVSERVDPRQHDVPRLWRLARRLLYPLADSLVIQTDAVRQWARWIVPAHRVRVIPNAARFDEVGAATAGRNQDVLAVGRLHAQKGFDLLLRAFASSCIAALGWRLVIVGEGPERARLHALAEDLGVADQVSLPGVTQAPERLMATCGMFVLSSRFEGFPNVLTEAMACGAPVIATDCPSGPAEIVRHETNGLLIPPEHVDALAGAMRQLAGDPDRRARLGAAALLDVRERFAPDSIATRWEQLIREVHGAVAG